MFVSNTPWIIATALSLIAVSVMVFLHLKSKNSGSKKPAAAPTPAAAPVAKASEPPKAQDTLSAPTAEPDKNVATKVATAEPNSLKKKIVEQTKPATQPTKNQHPFGAPVPEISLELNSYLVEISGAHRDECVFGKKESVSEGSFTDNLCVAKDTDANFWDVGMFADVISTHDKKEDALEACRSNETCVGVVRGGIFPKNGKKEYNLLMSPVERFRRRKEKNPEYGKNIYGLEEKTIVLRPDSGAEIYFMDRFKQGMAKKMVMFESKKKNEKGRGFRHYIPVMNSTLYNKMREKQFKFSDVEKET